MGIFGQPYTGSLRLIIKWGFENKLVELRQNVCTVNKVIQKKLETLGEDFEEKTQDMTPSQRNWYTEREAGEGFQLAEDFPALMWQSAFIRMYFILEYGVFDLCKTVRHGKNRPVR